MFLPSFLACVAGFFSLFFRFIAPLWPQPFKLRQISYLWPCFLVLLALVFYVWHVFWRFRALIDIFFSFPVGYLTLLLFIFNCFFQDGGSFWLRKTRLFKVEFSANAHIWLFSMVSAAAALLCEQFFKDGGGYWFGRTSTSSGRIRLVSAVALLSTWF